MKKGASLLRPACAQHAKPLDERGLAKRLRAYEVKPKVLSTDVGTLRGYPRADLEDQWRRYIRPSPAGSETSETTRQVPKLGGLFRMFRL